MQITDDDGRVCMMRGCTEADLLPAQCRACRKHFCSSHISYEAHQCPAHQDLTTSRCPICGKPVAVRPGQSADFAVSQHIDRGCREDQVGPARHNYCAAKGCSKNEIVLVLCDRCGSSVCIEHRHPSLHQCPCSTPPPAPEHHESPTDAKAKPKPSKKLSDLPFQNTRQAAFGLPPRSDAPQIHLQIYFLPELGIRPCWMSFSSKTVAGQVLDAVCRQGDVPNMNNAVAEEKRWTLYNLSREMQLPANLPLEELVADDDALLLVQGTSIPPAILGEVREAKTKQTCAVS